MRETVQAVKGTGAQAANVVLTNRALGLQALVLCRDSQITRPLLQVLFELGIAPKLYHEAAEALEVIHRRRFDLVIVDCDDTKGGVEFLQSVRRIPSHGMATILAIVNHQTSLLEAFKMGATLALGKPFSGNLLNLIFRASLGNMLRERRRAFRHPVEIPVVIHIDHGQDLRATVINLSEDGMAVQAPFPLPHNQSVRVRFVLPATKISIDAEAVIAWSERHGRSGIRFLNVQHFVRRHFESWLRDQFDQMTQVLQKQDASLMAREVLAGSRPLPLQA